MILTIEAVDASDLKSKIIDLYEQICDAQKVPAKSPKPKEAKEAKEAKETKREQKQVVVVEDATIAPTATVAIAVGGAMNVEPEQLVIKEVESVRVEKPISTAEVSKDAVIEALRAIATGEGGVQKSRDLLATFKAARIGELKVEQYADFIKACKNLK